MNSHWPGKDGAFERDHVADLPAEPFSKVPADDAAFAVSKEGLLLLGRDHEFGIEVQIGPGIHGEIGEKVLLVDIDSAEPVGIGDRLDAGNGRIFSP